MKPEKLALGCCMLALSAPAWAYLDPGAISLWLQGLVAAVAALAATFRLWWHKLAGLVRKNKKDALARTPADPHE